MNWSPENVVDGSGLLTMSDEDCEFICYFGYDKDFISRFNFIFNPWITCGGLKVRHLKDLELAILVTKFKRHLFKTEARSGSKSATNERYEGLKAAYIQLVVLLSQILSFNDMGFHIPLATLLSVRALCHIKTKNVYCLSPSNETKEAGKFCGSLHGATYLDLLIYLSNNYFY
jgi:hypothetical protein